MIRRVMTFTWLACFANLSVLGRTPVEVPYAVEISFADKFPGAFYQKWEFLRDHGLYETRFVYENQSYVAYFEEEGPFVASIALVSESILPQKVRTAINNLYREYEILKVEELWIQGDLSYIFEIRKDQRVTILRIASKGKTLSVQEKTKHYMQKKKFLRR